MTTVAEIISGKFAEALKKELPAWRRPWTGQRNMQSGREYTGLLNILLLLSSGFDHPLWVTSGNAKKLGGRIAKDQWSKRSILTFYKPYEQENKQTGEKEQRFTLRYWKVYNYEQTEGLEDTFNFVTDQLDPQQGKLAKAICRGYADRPRVIHQRGCTRAFYRPSDDTVVMPPRSHFTLEEGYWSTLFHELIHSTGDKARLERSSFKKDGLTTYGSEDYSQEELVAEMGAAVLCHKAGFSPAAVEDNAAYCRGWLKAINNDARLVIRAAQAASKAAKYILGENNEFIS